MGKNKQAVKLSRLTTKKYCLIIFGGILSHTGFAATSTSTIAVSATVLSTCLVTATPEAFGNYDPTGNTNLTGTSTITVTCTLGTPYNIGLDAGTGPGATVNNRKMSQVGGGGVLVYSLYQDGAYTTVWGNTIGTDTVAGTGDGMAQNFTVYGRVNSSQVTEAAAYTDTVTVTVTY